MSREEDHQIPLKSVRRTEEGQPENNTQNGSTVPRQNRKPFHSMKYVRICSILLLLLIGLGLIAYFIYTNLLKGHKQHYQNRIDPSGRGLTPPNPEVPLPASSSILHVFEKAAICSDSEVCSKVGRDILHRGGNVVDSALATLACNGIATMQSLGIGGGFLMNVFIKSENRAYTINAREMAPFEAKEDMFVGKPPTASYLGPLSIAVPGEVMGYHEAHKRFGSMTWKEILEPSIKMCEDGIELSKHMWDSLHESPYVKNDTHLRKTFVNNATGEFHKIGTVVFPSKELCQTYRHIAENGPMDFYNGSLAKSIAEDLEEIGSIVTYDDLQSYRADVISSITIPLNEDILHVVPPVGSGTVVGYMLNILRGYNFTASSVASVNETALTYHRIVEAFKFGFAKRWDLGDLRFTDLRHTISNFTSSGYAESIRREIDDTKTFDDPVHYGAHFSFKSENGTSHISIVAPNGDAVAVTSSINYYFGCGITGRRTGIIFNSGMEDFSTPGMSNYFGLPASPSNYIFPQKRGMSSMSPTIVTDREGEVKLVIGSAGGSKIITSVALIIARVLWFDQDIKQAMDAARFHHQMLPNVLEYEYGILEDVVKSFESKGHAVKRYKERGSAMCGIARNSTAVYGNADFRKKGGVAGF